ncbi:MAG: zinc metalloprotease HtpX [Proteobacteria bacterium SG_bin7]|nr:MAG: zinc metalloprotease HtpX [Proteobacteria bacterium SG_bin7]
MKIAKRVFLFVSVNILIIATISIAMSLLGVQSYLDAKGISYPSLMIFCVLWGFGGAFISLALSRIMAKWMMGVQIIDPNTHEPELRNLIYKVHSFAKKAGIEKMPEVGYYEADDLNAFATGPTKNRSLVAVSTGLLKNTSKDELDGVLAHEVAHIANGDMVTMTLVQGVVNAFVMFFARVVAFFASQFVAEEKRHIVQFGVVIALEIILGILGMIVVSFFSRMREYRADGGGAALSSRDNMISALERLKVNHQIPQTDDQPAIASLKISGKVGGLLKLFATHPDLDDRIERLKETKINRYTNVEFHRG